MSKDYETILETITTEQWEAIAVFAAKKVVGDKKVPVMKEPKGKAMSEKKLFWKVTELLHKVGAKSGSKGYQYLREAIIMVYGRWDYIHEVTTTLYPTIAAKFNTTPSRVERAMRHCIELFFEEGDMDALKDVFIYYPNKKKYTPRETIACMVEYLKKCDNVKGSFFG